MYYLFIYWIFTRIRPKKKKLCKFALSSPALFFHFVLLLKKKKKKKKKYPFSMFLKIHTYTRTTHLQKLYNPLKAET
jgi:hypothetical protein